MGARPSSHGYVPDPGQGGARLWPFAGDPSAAAVADAPRASGSGAGPCPASGLRRGAAAEGGEGSGGGGGFCSAAMQSRAESRARRPGCAPPPRRCCNAGVSTGLNRAEPARASRAPPGRPQPQPHRASALPPVLVPVSFSSRSCRDRGMFPPARCPPDLPLALSLPMSPHLAPGAGPPWAPPAVTLALRGFWLRLPPALGRLRSACCCTVSGLVLRLCPAPVQLLLGETPPSPRYLWAAPRGPPPSLSSEPRPRSPRGPAANSGTRPRLEGSHLRCASPRVASDTWPRTAGTRIPREGGWGGGNTRRSLRSGCPRCRGAEVCVGGVVCGCDCR